MITRQSRKRDFVRKVRTPNKQRAYGVLMQRRAKL